MSRETQTNPLLTQNHVDIAISMNSSVSSNWAFDVAMTSAVLRRHLTSASASTPDLGSVSSTDSLVGFLVIWLQSIELSLDSAEDIVSSSTEMPVAMSSAEDDAPIDEGCAAALAGAKGDTVLTLGGISSLEKSQSELALLICLSAALSVLMLTSNADAADSACSSIDSDDAKDEWLERLTRRLYAQDAASADMRMRLLSTLIAVIVCVDVRCGRADLRRLQWYLRHLMQLEIAAK